MDVDNKKPGLYGLKNSNRNFSDPYYWGKNQFNSAFPISLACYMRDREISAIYIRLNSAGNTHIDELPISTLFGSEESNEDLYFDFEARFPPFSQFVHDELVTIDCVTKSSLTGIYLRPIEIKLTTLPDNSTCEYDEIKYGCEIVIRSATMRYMALSMATSLAYQLDEVRQIFEPVCIEVRNWDNADEVKNKLPAILNALQIFFLKYHSLEKPLLVQPIWKTIGKSALLADNCLDIFVWSDFALTKLFMDSAVVNNASSTITRFQRAALRLARFLFEISRSGRVYQAPIYDGMTLGNQTDKEFAISGVKTYQYMSCERLVKPVMKKSDIKNIILGGGQKFLSPERRFDAVIYFSTDLFEG